MMTVAVAAWSAAASSATTPTPSTGASSTQEPTELTVPTESIDLSNPLSQGDFADPYYLETDQGLVAYATNAEGKNVPVATLEEDGSRPVITDALPQVASWSDPGLVWAPAVSQVGDQYVMYYTTIDRASQRQCISVATSASPTGPFVDTSTAPLVCDFEQGGSIDPEPVVDADGQRYLLWKNDGNCCELPTVIYSQPLDATGLHTTGEPVELIRNDQAWEGAVVEAPSMIAVDGIWYLFYSGNNWSSTEYATGYAVCDSPAGPCTKPTDQPVLASNDDRSGPGGAAAITAPDANLALVFAAWIPGEVGYGNGGERRVFVQPITISDSTVTVTPAA